jgi:HK97 family phage major capsid protein
MAVISRDDAAALLNTQDINEILQEAPKSSVALSTFRTIRMASTQAKMPVLSALPTAGFVSDDTEDPSSTKPTSNVEWENKFLNVEEIAVIVPIHENVFDDASFDIWAEVRPLIAQEFGRVLDGAVLFGTNKPTTWDASLEDGARTAGNVVDYSTVVGAGGDLAEAVNQVMGLVEADGFDVNQFYAKRTLRARLRGLRDDVGQPIYLDNIRSDGNTPTIYGEPIAWVTNGAWVNPTGGPPATNGADLIGGDRSKAIIGIRQDMTFKLLDQATVGGYNLAEKDMVALRCKMRVAFAVANPLTPEATGGYPFAILSD